MGHSIMRRFINKGSSTLILFAILAIIVLQLDCGGGTDQYEEKQNFYGPTKMAVEPFPFKEDGPYLYILNSWGGNLSIVRVSSEYDIIKRYQDDRFDDPDALWVGRAPLDIAITPDGALLYITDANLDYVYTMDPQEEWTRTTIPVELKAAKVSIVPALIDSETLDSTVPAAWNARHEIWFADPEGSRLLVWDHQAKEITGEIALPSPPADLQVSRDGERVFVTGEDATVYVVEAAAQTLAAETVYLGGRPHHLVESMDGTELYILDRDPARLRIIDTAAWQALEEEISFNSALNDMTLSTDGDLGFIVADDGMLYYFYCHSHRICGSHFSKPIFYDHGVVSNPTLTDVETADCVTKEEDWKITYRQALDAWEVEGSTSGLQYSLAYTDQAYESDRGGLKFTVRANDLHPSDGDNFRLSTDVDQVPIPVGTSPQGVIASPIIDELGEDRVFVTNTGTDSISRVLTADTDETSAID